VVPITAPPTHGTRKVSSHAVSGAGRELVGGRRTEGRAKGAAGSAAPHTAREAGRQSGLGSAGGRTEGGTAQGCTSSRRHGLGEVSSVASPWNTHTGAWPDARMTT
jgi:hypothetical protein